MKTIKKLSLVAIVTVLSIGFASAQIGVEAGYTNLKSTEKNAEGFNGFYVGPTFDMQIQGPISLQYGLLYNLNMKSKSTTILGVKNSASYKKHSLDIPVRVAAAFPLNNITISIFAGPNFNIGLASTGTVEVGSIKKSSNLYDNKDLSRFDLQLGGGASIQYNNIGLRFSYDFGMLNRYKDIDSKENNLKVGLFYNF